MTGPPLTPEQIRALYGFGTPTTAYRAGLVQSEVDEPSDEEKRISNIVRGANAWRERQLLGEAETEKRKNFLASKIPDWLQDDGKAYRNSIERVGLEFTDNQALFLIGQITDFVHVDYPSIEVADIATFVAENLFKNSSYDPEEGLFEPGKVPDDISWGPTWQNFAQQDMNRYQVLLERDPRFMLIEHQVRLAVLEGVENKSFGEDSDIIGAVILEGTYPDSWDIDTTTREYQTAKARYGLQLPNVLADIKDALRSPFNSFTDGRGIGNLRDPIANIVESSPYTFFGDFAVEPVTTGIDAYLFRTDDEYFIKRINDAIERGGGITDTNDEGVTGHPKHAIEDANRMVKDAATEERALWIDENGNINQYARARAHRDKIIPEQWVVGRVMSFTEGYFRRGPGGMTAYEQERVTKLEAFRAADYLDNPDKAGKQIKNILELNPDYWVNDVPVEEKDVRPQDWARWKQYLIQNGQEEAEVFIASELRNAVRAKEEEDFEENFTDKVAADQAKEYFARNGIKWSDVPWEQQYRITRAVHSSGGLDVNQAMFGQIYDGDETVGGVNESALFGESLLEYATGAIQERSAAKTFGESLANPVDLIYDIAKERGVLHTGASTEFFDNFDRSVLPSIARRVMAGDYASMDELRAEIENQMSSMPAYEINSTDYDRQMGATPPAFPGGPGFRVQPATPAFDVSSFTPELQTMAMERPELAGFIQQQIQLPGFEKQWQQAAQRQVRHDREADTQLQEDRLASFQSAYDRAVAGGDESVIAQAERNLQSAQTQFDRETGAAFPTYKVDPGTLGAEDAPFLTAEAVKRFYPMLEAKGKSIRGKVVPTGEVSPTGIQQEGLFGAAGQYVTPAGQPGEGTVFNIYSPAQQQTLAGMAKMMTTAGATQREFFEKQLPGFQKRFEASPFFRMEQERLAAETETEERRAESEERAEESRRRGRLRGGALTVFGRRQ